MSGRGECRRNLTRRPSSPLRATMAREGSVVAFSHNVPLSHPMGIAIRNGHQDDTPCNYGHRTSLAHSVVRGTRTAETDMCRQRASGRAAGTGPERARAAGCAHRRTGAAGGDGRYSDRAGCRSWADEARILRRTGKRGRSDRRAVAPARPCQPRGPPPPPRNAAMRNAPDREATMPERNLTIAERYGRNAGRRISRASTVGAVDRAR